MHRTCHFPAPPRQVGPLFSSGFWFPSIHFSVVRWFSFFLVSSFLLGDPSRRLADQHAISDHRALIGASPTFQQTCLMAAGVDTHAEGRSYWRIVSFDEHITRIVTDCAVYDELSLVKSFVACRPQPCLLPCCIAPLSRHLQPDDATWPEWSTTGMLPVPACPPTVRLSADIQNGPRTRLRQVFCNFD